MTSRTGGTGSGGYFAEVSAGTGQPSAPGRFVHLADVPTVVMGSGLRGQPVQGTGTLLSFVELDPHSVAPVHAHVEEQLVIVLDGQMDFEIDGVVQTMRPGDIALVPPWVPHGARTGESSCRELDVFNPPRIALLELAEAARGR